MAIKAAIDIGTFNSEIYVPGKGLLLRYGANEKDENAYQTPSVIARYIAPPRKVIAVGQQAYDMMGRVPPGIEIVKAVKAGRIHDPDAFVNIVTHQIGLAFPNFKPQSALKWMTQEKIQIVISVPCNATPNEIREIRRLLKWKGRDEVFLVSQPIAAAIGADLNFRGITACAILDIGGGTSDLGVLCSGKKVFADSLEDLGGDLINKHIVEMLRDRYRLIIGDHKAEVIKRQLGSTRSTKERLTLDVDGRSVDTNAPETKTICNDDVRDVIIEVLNKIVDGLMRLLDDIPYHDQGVEIHGDIKKNGIWLTGGGSLIEGCADFLSEKTGLIIQPVKDPLLSVINGTAEILKDKSLLEEFSITQHSLAS